MSNKGAKILVVDDDPINIQITCQVLEPAGFKTFGAVGGDECLRLVRELRPDLVLLDLNMPNLSGLDVCNQMKSDPELQDIFVILFSSSHTDSDSKSVGLESGADGFISRPITNRELIARVQSMLRIQKAECAMRKTLAQWQATFDSVGDIVFLTDANFKVLNCNRATTQFFRLSSKQIIGKKCHEIIHCNNSPILECPFRRVMENKHRETFVFEREDRWLEVSMDPVVDSTGNSTGTVHVIKDITERKQAEEELRLQSEVTANMAEGVALVKVSEAKIVYANPKFEEMFGYSCGELLGKDVSTINAPAQKNPEDVARDIQNALQKTGMWSGEVYNIKKTGETFWCSANISTFDHPVYGKVWVTVQSDITKRKMAEERLRKSELVMAQAGMIAHLGAWEIQISNPENINANSLLWSDEAYRIFGYEPGSVDVTNDLFFQHVHPDDRQIVADALSRSLSGKQSYEVEHRIIRKDGIERNVLEFAEIAYDDVGNPIRILGAVQDITERKQIDVALQESEAKYRLIAENADDWIYWRAADNKVHFVSPSCELVTGYTPQEFIDNPDFLLEITHPEDREVLANHFATVGENTEYSHLEYRIIQKSGETRWISHSCSPLYRDGKFAGRRGTNQDITERKQADESLRQSEMRFATIFNASPVAIGISQFDDAKLLDVNEAWEGLTGYSRSEVLGQSPVEFGLWVDPQQRQEMLQMVLEQGRAHIDVQFRHKLGRVCDVMMLAEAIELSGKACLLTMWQDITLRKQAEAELKKRASQLALINEVGQKIAGVLAIQGVLELAARLVNETFGYYHVALFIFDEQNQYFAMRARAGQFSNYFPENHLIPLGEGMVGTVGKSGQMMLSNDVRVAKSYRNYFPELLPTAAELSLPIRVGDKVVGVLDVQSPYQDAFTNEDVKVLEILADQVAVALENARLYETAWKELFERKKIENELMQHRDHLEELVEARTAEVQDLYNNSPCGYHSLDANGNFAMINQTELTWLGYTRDEIIGRPISDLFSERSLAKFKESFPVFKQSGQLMNLDLELVRKDGSILPILVNATAIYDAAGNFVMSRSTIFDNTERLRAEKSLRESEEQNRLLFDETPEAICLLGMTGKFIRANRAFEQLIKIPLAKIIGKSAVELGVMVKEEYAVLENKFDQAFTDQRSFTTVEYMLFCGDGSQRNVESRLFRLKFGGDDLILVVSRDISAQKEAEEALRRANKEMVQAMRLKDEFLASMSHELRTPLTGILGLSEALQLQTYGEFNEKQLKALKNIENSGRHLLDLINDILDLSKIEAGKLEMQFEPCSLGDICQASLQITKGLAHQKHQAVSFSMDPASIIIRADARRLKQMLVNLLSNAIKFTPEDGSLGLEVHASESTQTVKIAVWDKGIGIAPEDMTRLFRPFVQLDSSLSRQHSGTGLGLSLVQRMAELQGGSIQVESVPGEGSRFTIHLRWSPDSTQPVPVSRRSTGSLGTSLTVDDNEIDAQRITRYMRQLDITNVVHPYGNGAVDLAASLKPGVIVLDLHLPDTSGFGLLSRFKADARTSHIPIVVCSIDENRVEAAAQGATGYLVKPFTLAELRDQLSQIPLQKRPEMESTGQQPTGPHVLVVDDNQTTLQIISDFLESRHFRVTTVTNGVDALDAASKIHLDIILMDIQMPGLDGLEATRRIRAHSDPDVARLPIIALTALAMPGDREMCLQAGVNEYMSKPLQLKSLVEVIQAMVRQR